MLVDAWMFCIRGWTLFRGEHAVVAHVVWWLEDFGQKLIHMKSLRKSVLLNADTGMTPTSQIAH